MEALTLPSNRDHAHVDPTSSAPPTTPSAPDKVTVALATAMGAHYRHTTPEMAARVVEAIQLRLTIALDVAERALEKHPNRSALRVF